MFDADVGLYWYHARWYDPHTGRFISQDPSGFGAGDFNLYRYVNNDPTNNLDPTGLMSMASTPAPLIGDTGATFTGSGYLDVGQHGGGMTFINVGNSSPGGSSTSDSGSGSGDSGSDGTDRGATSNASEGWGSLMFVSAGGPWSADARAFYNRMTGKMRAMHGQGPRDEDSGSTFLNDLYLMAIHPVDTTIGYHYGLLHGSAIVGNAFTFGKIDMLDSYVKEIVAREQGAYEYAHISAQVAAFCAYAAAPCTMFARAAKAMEMAASIHTAYEGLRDDNPIAAITGVLGIVAGASGNWCFVAGTQVVVGVEEIPTEAHQTPIVVGASSDAKHLSSILAVGAGVLGFVALQPSEDTKGRRRSRRMTSKHCRRRGLDEFARIVGEEDAMYSLDSEEGPSDDAPSRGCSVETPANDVDWGGFIFELNGNGATAVAAERAARSARRAVAVAGADTHHSTVGATRDARQARAIPANERHQRKAYSAGRIFSAGRMWLAACLLLAAWVALGRSASRETANTDSSATAPSMHVRARYVTRNIEDLKVGDKVLAWDEWSGRQQLQPIDRVYRRVADHLRILRIRAADGDEQTIQTTNEHPFWVPGEGWLDAADLDEGDSLLQPDGQMATLFASSLELHPEGIAVFNLRVEHSHTYYVADRYGVDPILVHNASQTYDEMIAAARNLYPKKTGYEMHHVIPKYVGGPPDGLRVQLEAAFHQTVTNWWRKNWAYGQKLKPSPEKLDELMQQFRDHFPIPGI
jgi:RHS repeat-associated protein